MIGLGVRTKLPSLLLIWEGILAITLNVHELGFAEFLAEPSRRRVKVLLELGPKRRQGLRDLLDHSVKLDPAYCRPLRGGEAYPIMIERSLRRLNAPDTCYVISSDDSLDGCELPLRRALEDVSGSDHGTYISCVPGKLGYFEYEDMNSAFLLNKG